MSELRPDTELCPKPTVEIYCRWCGTIGKCTAPGALCSPHRGNIWCSRCGHALGEWQLGDEPATTRLVVYGNGCYQTRTWRHALPLWERIWHRLRGVVGCTL